MFWFGQGLSSIGDAFALIAIPLLVLQVTGSVAQMGLATATFGCAQIISGMFSGMLVDRVDRRWLMIICDLGRAVLYGAVPLGWFLIGPHLWFLYLATFVGELLGMCFGIAYITAIANLVEKEQLGEANGLLQATYGLAFFIGPVVAGVVCARIGPQAALGVDAVTFLISALSLSLVRFSRRGTRADHPSAEPVARGKALTEFVAGVRFLFQQPVLRTMTIFFCLLNLTSLAAMDLFIFHLKHDLHQGDDSVGIVFGIASIGAIAAGLLASRIRSRWGFGVCWLGGFVGNGILFFAIGLADNLILVGVFAILYSFAGPIMGIASMTIRQEITPDHLLGRVTAAFWTLIGIPGPIGAALATGLAARFGAPHLLMAMGVFVLVTATFAIGSPVCQRYPERAVRS